MECAWIGGGEGRWQRGEEDGVRMERKGGGRKPGSWREGEVTFFFFYSLCATKAVRVNNERGEWCVSREALSRVG